MISGSSSKPSSSDPVLSVRLPKTSFEMRGKLPKKEPEFLEKWAALHLEEKRRALHQKNSAFTLHDGPPYANGHLHLGHAVNKIAKDILNRFWWGQGFATPYQPGWDCHGLPIEAKVEEGFKKQGKSKGDVSTTDFRTTCHNFAQKWINIQRDEFLRMGIAGAFDTPYTTMAHESEASIMRGFFRLFEQGHIYQGLRPVLWSPVEETALAEAEVEYKEVTSTAVYVGFPLANVPASHPHAALLEKAQALIWTTTPWTLPANRAIAFGEFPYVLVRLKSKEAQSQDMLYLIAEPCLARVLQDTGAHAETLATLAPENLAGLTARHPLYNQGYSFTVPLLHGDHVTSDAGTGLVHTAPDHGVEDFALGKTHNLELAHLVTGAGTFKEGTPLFADQHVYKVAPAVKEALHKESTLFHASTLTHSYPHSWRSKTPLIYRTTPQWFLALDGTPSLRRKALQALDTITFVPESGKNRLKAMLEGRPDWCLSRQRLWGIPLMLFVHKETGEPLVRTDVNEALAARIAQEGVDFWWTATADDLLAPFSLSGYSKVMDILDVWFESGMTHMFALKNAEDCKNKGEASWPANLYLEGSDQHRGWFQSSLVLSTALRDGSPFQTLMTHGFVVNADGHKMSKSSGNTLAPAALIQEKGADILRLWVANANLYEDIKIGQEAFRHTEDIYRRLRNTCRFLLGNLAGTTPTDLLPVENLPLLERWLCDRLVTTHTTWVEALKACRISEALQAVHTLCNQDLSAFYFDVRKDALYCDHRNSETRRGTVTALWHTLTHLLRWLAPFLPFTAEDAFCAAKADLGDLTCDWPDSVHLWPLDTPPSSWCAETERSQITHLRDMRLWVSAAIEKVRAQGNIRSALETHPVVAVKKDQHSALHALMQGTSAEDCATLCITSGFSETPPASDLLHQDSPAPGIHVAIYRALGEKCNRCWRYQPLHTTKSGVKLCSRCTDAVQQEPNPLTCIL